MNRESSVENNVPFFSVAVPTYDRKDLLRQTISSLLGQTFADFEILIGNDYPNETLSAEYLGIRDARVRIFNNKSNLGELGNMNFLLGQARGRYFTWQFDDDPCSSNLLREIHEAVCRCSFPAVLFTSFTYIYGSRPYRFAKTNGGGIQLYGGREFLRKYLSGGLRALGCCGFYEVEYLRGLGGVRRLSDGPMALHSEYLLLIKTGLLTRIAYIPAQLVSTRVHDQSWTIANNDVELFKKAGRNLIRESLAILSRAELCADFGENLSSILRAVLSSVIVKSILQNKILNKGEINEYVSALRSEFDPLQGSEFFDQAMAGLNAACRRMRRDIFKAKVKKVMPKRCWKYVHIARSLVARYSNKAF